jgi:predicted aldo/keto reductase-like oxidoreductase
VNVHWYYVNDLNWPSIEEATRQDMGVFIISPSDKGGKLYDPPQKMVDLCQPLTPIQFNDLYCLARPQVHTLSVGAARPTDFDEHIGALQYYDNIEQTIAPIEQRLRAKSTKSAAAIGTAVGSKACRNQRRFRTKSTCAKSCVCGHTPSRST